MLSICKALGGSLCWIPRSISSFTGTGVRGIAHIAMGLVGTAGMSVVAVKGRPVRSPITPFCFALGDSGGTKAFSSARSRYDSSLSAPLCVCSCPSAAADVRTIMTSKRPIETSVVRIGGPQESNHFPFTRADEPLLRVNRHTYAGGRFIQTRPTRSASRPNL